MSHQLRNVFNKVIEFRILIFVIVISLSQKLPQRETSSLFLLKFLFYDYKCVFLGNALQTATTNPSYYTSCGPGPPEPPNMIRNKYMKINKFPASKVVTFKIIHFHFPYSNNIIRYLTSIL